PFLFRPAERRSLGEIHGEGPNDDSTVRRHIARHAVWEAGNSPKAHHTGLCGPAERFDVASEVAEADYDGSVRRHGSAGGLRGSEVAERNITGCRGPAERFPETDAARQIRAVDSPDDDCAVGRYIVCLAGLEAWGEGDQRKPAGLPRQAPWRVAKPNDYAAVGRRGRCPDIDAE